MFSSKRHSGKFKPLFSEFISNNPKENQKKILSKKREKNKENF